jgi:hypothetical protein
MVLDRSLKVAMQRPDFMDHPLHIQTYMTGTFIKIIINTCVTVKMSHIKMIK